MVVAPTSTAASPSIQAAQNWAAMDPNPITTRHTLDLVEKASSSDEQISNDALESLESYFPSDTEKRIGFGTAGLRAEMKPGPMGMNDLTVCQAAQGLAKYCLEKQQQQIEKQTQDKPPQKLCAVVGYDHRSHPTLKISSLSFAILTAIVFAEAGIDCLLLHNFCLTPLVPFCIQKLGAACGVMVTASHNPRQDNGYKVYDSDACQIRSPTDRAIASHISHNLEPWNDYQSIIEERQKLYPNDPCLGLSNPKATSKLLDEYFDSLQQSGLRTLARPGNIQGMKPPSFAYTAMHGIGHPFAKRAFDVFGLAPFRAVPEQRDPDPSFPTVPFPNPEEKGALDLAKTFAEEQNCDIVLANDPDADRLAVAEKNRSTGTWRTFSGDQIGTMLGLWIWERIGKDSPKPVSMCTSTVSSKMLAEIGRIEGFHVEECLTGFKWIGSRSAELQAEGYHHLFGYEEAIGFACGDVIFDKDGISAMVVMAELAEFLYREKGMTLSEHMDHLSSKYGFFCSKNGYYRTPNPTIGQSILDNLRSGGTYQGLHDKLASLPTRRNPIRVLSIRDLGFPGYDSTNPPDFVPKLPVSKSAPLLTLQLSNGCRVQLRPSGTEPKFKYYLEMKGETQEAAQEELEYVESVLLDVLVEPIRNGLRR